MSINDRNFDGIADHFQNKIYGSHKGEFRLARLWKDFEGYLPELMRSSDLSVLDAGGGFGQLAHRFALSGNQVVLSDISSEMLERAQAQHRLIENSEEVASNAAFCEAGSVDMRYVHSPIQQLEQHLSRQSFDFVMCHAVLEWVEDPRAVLSDVLAFAKPGAFFSVTVYNKSAVYFRNLLKGNFRWVDRWMEEMDDPNSDPGLTMLKGKSLTPPGPLLPQTVDAWLAEQGCQVIKKTGIRVLDDYLNKHLTKGHALADILEKEQYFGIRSPYALMGRYVHFLGRKY